MKWRIPALFLCAALLCGTFSGGLLIGRAEEGPAALPGDVDGDGKVTTTDARMTLQYSGKKITLDAGALLRAEVDGTAGVSTTDARLILQYAAKKIRRFPVEAALLTQLRDLLDQTEDFYDKDGAALTDESREALEAWMENATALIRSGGSGAEIQAAIDEQGRIMDALAYVTTPADVLNLISQLEAAKNQYGFMFTKESLDSVQKVLDDAKTLANSGTATPEQLDEALETIYKAIYLLRPAQATTVDELKASIRDVRSFAAQFGDLYTDETVVTLNNAITAAEAVANDANSTDDQRSEAMMGMIAALGILMFNL